MHVFVVTLDSKGDQVVFSWSGYVCVGVSTRHGFYQDRPVEFLFPSLHPLLCLCPCQSLSYYPFLYHGKGIIGATKTQLNLPVMDKSLKRLIQRVFVGTEILISIAKWS